MDTTTVTPGEFRMLPRQAAAVLEVAVRSVGRWADAGRLSFLRTVGGHRRYREREVLALRQQMIAEATA